MQANTIHTRGSGRTLAISAVAGIVGTLGYMYVAGKQTKREEGPASIYASEYSPFPLAQILPAPDARLPARYQVLSQFSEMTQLDVGQNPTYEPPQVANTADVNFVCSNTTETIFSRRMAEFIDHYIFQPVSKCRVAIRKNAPRLRHPLDL
ncbi:hypothetical protein C8Q74DRAFT_231350 [Fomes fomentarius]|nr:hypothetical protein C8Q74DRAFT_231350 [Fomes fomentarius]